MKKLILIALMAVIIIPVQAQKEYAPQKFYSTFRLLDADAQKNFSRTKGVKLKSTSYLNDIYTSKILLPGADSATIIIPLRTGRPSVTFYMNTFATLEAARQQEALLLAAIKKAYRKPLVQRQQIDTIKQYIFYSTRLFKDARNSAYEQDFETYILPEDGQYKLRLVINRHIAAKKD